MKWFWTAIAVIQIALLTAYAAWAASADYFVKMPASVSRGTSVTALVAWRVAWLALVMAAFDLSIATWISGVRAFQTSKSTSPWLSFLTSIAVFLVACALLAIFVVFSMPQY
jgi:hypothetical protein